MDSFDDLFKKVELFYASQAETFGGLPKDSIQPFTNEDLIRHSATISSKKIQVETLEISVDSKIQTQENQVLKNDDSEFVKDSISDLDEVETPEFNIESETSEQENQTAKTEDSDLIEDSISDLDEVETPEFNIESETSEQENQTLKNDDSEFVKDSISDLDEVETPELDIDSEILKQENQTAENEDSDLDDLSEIKDELLDLEVDKISIKTEFEFEEIIEEIDETDSPETPVLSLEEEIKAKNESSENDDENAPKRDLYTIDLFGDPEPVAKKEAQTSISNDLKTDNQHQKTVLALHIPKISPLPYGNPKQSEIDLETLNLLAEIQESESFEITPSEPILFVENEPESEIETNKSALSEPKSNEAQMSVLIDEELAQSPVLTQSDEVEIKESPKIIQTETKNSDSKVETSSAEKTEAELQPIQIKKSDLVESEIKSKTSNADLKAEKESDSFYSDNSDSVEQDSESKTESELQPIQAEKSEAKAQAYSIENPESTELKVETESTVYDSKSKTEVPNSAKKDLIKDDSDLQVSLDDDDNYDFSNRVFVAPTYIPLKHISPMQLHVQLSQCTTLDELKALCEIHSDLLKTDLVDTNLVFGFGNPKAKLLIVGEAPGENEDLTGEPFVGRAGQLLDKILAAINLDRKEVYIANILKHRPPNNRDPLPEERDRSLPFLIRQIEIIQPKLVLCLGRISAKTLLGLPNSVKLSDIRGKFHPFLRGMELTATYHPASLMRNPAWKKAAWDDVKMVRSRYDEV